MLLLCFGASHKAQAYESSSLLFQQVNDSIPADSIPATYERSRQPTYIPQDRMGDPFSDPDDQSSLIQKDPFGHKPGDRS